MSEIAAPTLKEFWDDLIGGNPVVLQAVDSTHGYVVGTDDFLDDISGGSFLGDAITLTHSTTTAGELKATATTITGPINGGEFVDALVIYADTGTPSTSRILAFIDKNGDGTDMNKEGDGADMAVSFPSDVIARI